MFRITLGTLVEPEKNARRGMKATPSEVRDEATNELLVREGGVKLNDLDAAFVASCKDVPPSALI